MSIQPNMTRLIEDVREGKLDFALTKPEDAQVLVSVREVRIWQAVDVFSGLIVLGFGALARSRPAVGVADAARVRARARLRRGSHLLLLARHRDRRVLGREHVARGRALRRRLPDRSLADRDLPGWLRYGVTFLVPIAFAVTVPAEALTSRLDWETLALAIGFAVVFFAFTRWFWRFGLSRYSGASA